jgi:chromosome segregation ATPase
MDLAMAGWVVAAAAATGGIVFGAVRARADKTSADATEAGEKRADVKEALDLKDEVIAALREANDELRKQNERAAAREEKWVGERADLLKRVTDVEASLRDVLIEAMRAGICAKAPDCPNYVPPGASTDGKD